MHGFHFKFNKIANRLAALSRQYPGYICKWKIYFARLKFVSNSIKYLLGKSVFRRKPENSWSMQSNCHCRANNNGVSACNRQLMSDLLYTEQVYIKCHQALCSKYENCMHIKLFFFWGNSVCIFMTKMYEQIKCFIRLWLV